MVVATQDLDGLVYFIVCKMLLLSLTLCDTTFLTRSVQPIFAIEHQGSSDLLSVVCKF